MGSSNSKSPLDPSKLLRKDLPRSRSLANQHLAAVFGLLNAFTTFSPQCRRAFSLNALKLMNAASAKGTDWTALRDFAVHYARHYLPDDEQHEENSQWEDTGVQKSKEKKDISTKEQGFSFVDYIRATTLAFSTRWLFKLDDPEPDAVSLQGDMAFVGRRINQLWLASKRPPGPDKPLPLWAAQTDLHEALARITSIPVAQVVAPQTNPLNLLIPAWETTWRVVLRGVISLECPPQQWAPVMARFVEIPTAERFCARENNGDGEGVSAMDVVKEILRLYPPTKRIYRMGAEGPWTLDLQALHRSSLLGGKSVLEFDPSRWAEIGHDAVLACGHVDGEGKEPASKEELRRGFGPFGFGICPADGTGSQDFGWKMLGLLMGAVLGEMRNGRWTIHGLAGEEWGLLKVGREDYEDLILKRVES